MKTLTLSSLLLLAGLLAACGGGVSYFDPAFPDPGGDPWWYKPGAPIGQVDIQNDPVTAAGLPNEHVIVHITLDGQTLEGVTVAPGEIFPLPVDPTVDHVLEFEYDDGTRATRPEPEAPIRVEVGETIPLVVTY